MAIKREPTGRLKRLELGTQAGINVPISSSRWSKTESRGQRDRAGTRRCRERTVHENLRTKPGAVRPASVFFATSWRRCELVDSAQRRDYSSPPQRDESRTGRRHSFSFGGRLRLSRKLAQPAR